MHQTNHIGTTMGDFKAEAAVQSKIATAAVTGSAGGVGLNQFQPAAETSLDQWASIASISVSVATGVFVLLQGAFLLWKWNNMRKDRKNAAIKK
jgi:hypothetical protein